MIARSMTFAAQLTRTWVAMYTAGLAEELACTRRDEIESDLWEQEMAGGLSNGEALARLVIGMPADVTWRLEQRGSASEESQTQARSLTMVQRLSGRGLTLLALLLAGFFIVPSSLVLLHVGGDLSTGERIFFGTLGITCGIMMLTGLLLSDRSPWLAAGLLSLAAVGMAALWFWLFFILIPAALVVITLAVSRARRAEGGGGSAAPA